MIILIFAVYWCMTDMGLNPQIGRLSLRSVHLLPVSVWVFSGFLPLSKNMHVRLQLIGGKKHLSEDHVTGEEPEKIWHREVFLRTEQWTNNAQLELSGVVVMLYPECLIGFEQTLWGTCLDLKAASLGRTSAPSQFYLYSPISRITNLPHGALQSVQHLHHPLSLDF